LAATRCAVASSQRAVHSISQPWPQTSLVVLEKKFDEPGCNVYKQMSQLKHL